MIRKSVSLTLFVTFLVMSFSGAILFIAPAGKAARFLHWEILGLSKHQYVELHFSSVTLFTVLACWHIANNWKPLIGYLKNSTKKITFYNKELLIALCINIFLVAGTLLGIQPFKAIVDINSEIKTYWDSNENTY